MKLLKLKSVLFSLFMVALISVFLTSCEKDFVQSEPINSTEIPTKEVDDDNSTENQSKKEKVYILPVGYDDLSEGEIKDYLTSIDDATMTQLVESRKIAHYFRHLDKLDQLDSNSKTGDIFNEATLRKHLNENEIQAYQTFEVPTEEESYNKSAGCDCGSWSYVGPDSRRVCRRVSYIQVCDCVHFNVEVRECGGSWTCWFYREYREDYQYTIPYC